MSQEHNVGFRILEIARRIPDQIAICDGQRDISFGELAEVSINVALNLRARDAARGSTVAVRSDDLLVVLSTVFATALPGCRWVFAARANSA